MSARRNQATLFSLVLLVGGMVGLAFASVPLYRLFCQVTGYGGTTQTAQALPDAPVERVITIRFNADTNPDLPWTFKPSDVAVDLRVGEEGLTFYRAVNQGPVSTVGTATYNVTPQKAGIYFNKIECFCFTEQLLRPGEAMDMPVSFFVDPAIVDDPNLNDVSTITLSYTFFPAKLEQDEIDRRAADKMAEAAVGR
ncbi:MAG: cytochrome c oxidase assembly protein [Alphaproteobacteria bacterium]|nr:cytochrome c oxidase assembly protein [Alphaproteobacteria bacterium]